MAGREGSLPGGKQRHQPSWVDHVWCCNCYWSSGTSTWFPSPSLSCPKQSLSMTPPSSFVKHALWIVWTVWHHWYHPHHHHHHYVHQAASLPVCLECASPLTSETKYRCGLCNLPLCSEACQVHNFCQLWWCCHLWWCQVMMMLSIMERIVLKHFSWLFRPYV